MSHSLADKIFSVKEKLTDQEFKELMEEVGKLNKEEKEMIRCKFMEVSVLETVELSSPLDNHPVVTRQYRPYVRFFSKKVPKSKVDRLNNTDNNFPLSEHSKAIIDLRQRRRILPQIDIEYYNHIYFLGVLSHPEVMYDTDSDDGIFLSDTDEEN